MPGRILVTGGTGVLGREVVRQLAEGDRVVRVLSRRPAPDGGQHGAAEWAVGDLGTGRGVAAAVADVDTIIHCASDSRHARRDLPGVRGFLDAAGRAGVAHLVYISIVGIDRVPLGYYRVKLAEERLIQNATTPWTILRATQFHDLVHLIAATLARLPVVPVPAGTSIQPVDTTDVAARLVALASGPPAGRVPDLGGPQVRGLADLVRAFLRATGRRGRVLPVWLPGRVARTYRQGWHLAPAHADGRGTFEQYLARRHPADHPAGP